MLEFQGIASLFITLGMFVGFAASAIISHRYQSFPLIFLSGQLALILGALYTVVFVRETVRPSEVATTSDVLFSSIFSNKESHLGEIGRGNEESKKSLS